MNKQLKFIAITAVLLAVALIIGFVEQSIPPIFPYLPFVKIGLGNVVILFTLIYLGIKPAAIISVLKSVLVPVFVGNPVMILYSLPASIAALIVMSVLTRTQKLTLPTISTISALMHIFIQVSVAAIMTGSALVYGYLGYLFIISSVSGFAVGVATHFVIRKFPELVL